MAAVDGREPNYYEVALTNRQVLVAFLALLLGLMVSFLAGVWLGKSQPPVSTAEIPAQSAEPPTAGPPAAEPATKPTAEAAGEEEGIDQLTFFEPKAEEPAPEPAAEVAPPPVASTEPPRTEPPPATPPAAAPSGGAPATPGEGPRWTRRLARDAAQLEGEMAREEAELAAGKPAAEAPSDSAPAAPAAAAPAAPAPAPTAPASKPAPARPATGVFVVQVFSSKDVGKAREILNSLQEAGYPATLSRADQGMYRVRVGPYRDRAAAERSATDVNRKFKFDTWITSE